MQGNNMEPVAVLCVNKVEDGEGVYNLPGKRYEILEVHEDTFHIETEPGLSDVDEISIDIEDTDFLIIYQREEE